MKIEFCIESYEEYILAVKHNADRVELCTALDVGGLTPSFGLIEKCHEQNGTEIHVMIRPRPGDFYYSSSEIDIMKRDIIKVGEKGVKGVVFGIANENEEIDTITNKLLVQLAKSYKLEVTFHRLFDLLPNPILQLNKLIEIGFDRLLTSGGEKTAIEGLHTLIALKAEARGRIQIMAGSGVNQTNIVAFKKADLDGAHFVSHRKLEDYSPFGFGKNREIDMTKVEEISNVLNIR
jgi:copper homeostasis protein